VHGSRNDGPLRWNRKEAVQQDLLAVSGGAHADHIAKSSRRSQGRSEPRRSTVLSKAEFESGKKALGLHVLSPAPWRRQPDVATSTPLLQHQHIQNMVR